MDCLDQRLCTDCCRKVAKKLIKIWKIGKNCDHRGKKVEKKNTQNRFLGTSIDAYSMILGLDITMMVVGRA